MYSNADFERNKQQRSRMLGVVLLSALPAFLVSIAGFALRIELLCTGALLICGAILIFLYDMKLKPVLRYGRYLREIHSGLSHKTAGRLLSIGQDPVYTDGVWLYEVILNIYEDLSEEGERRFLLDCTKQIPSELVGQDIALTSHGNYVLDAALLEAGHAAE